MLGCGQVGEAAWMELLDQTGIWGLVCQIS